MLPDRKLSQHADVVIGARVSRSGTAAPQSGDLEAALQPGQVGKGGIVREPELHQAACEKVIQAVRQFGFDTAIMDSPILGAEGNKEFLLHGRP